MAATNWQLSYSSYRCAKISTWLERQRRWLSTTDKINHHHHQKQQPLKQQHCCPNILRCSLAVASCRALSQRRFALSLTSSASSLVCVVVDCECWWCLWLLLLSMDAGDDDAYSCCWWQWLYRWDVDNEFDEVLRIYVTTTHHITAWQPQKNNNKNERQAALTFNCGVLEKVFCGIKAGIAG